MKSGLWKAMFIVVLMFVLSGCGHGGGGDGGQSVNSLTRFISGAATSTSGTTVTQISDAGVTITSFDQSGAALPDSPAGTTNPAGGFGLPVKMSESGGFVIVTVKKDGYADYTKRIDFPSPNDIHIAANMPEVQVQTVAITPEGALFQAPGTGGPGVNEPAFVFNVVRYPNGAQRAVASNKDLRKAQAAGAASELQIAIPASSVPAGITSLIGKFRSFDPSSGEAQNMPSWIDDQGNQLVSQGFEYISITDPNGTDLGAIMNAAKKSKGLFAALTSATPLTVITKDIHTGPNCNALLRDEDPATDGFQITVWQFNGEKGYWESVGQGTVVDSHGNVIPADQVTPTDCMAHIESGNLYNVTVNVANERFIEPWWNLDSAIMGSNANSTLCISGRVTDQFGTPIPNLPLAVNSYASWYAQYTNATGITDSSGNYTITSTATTNNTSNLSGNITYIDPDYNYSVGRQFTFGNATNCGTQNITITKSTCYVSGKIIGSSSEPVVNKNIGISTPAPTYGVYYGGALTDSEGRFKKTVQCGKDYDLTVGPNTLAHFDVDASTTDFPDYEQSDAGYQVTLKDIQIDTIPPVVTSVSPANGAADVSTDTAISFTFSKPLSPSTVRYQPATLKPADGGDFIPGKAVFDPASNTVTFTPAVYTYINGYPISLLSGNTAYTVTISTGITDLSGNSMAAPYSWSFTTGAAIPALTSLMIHGSPSVSAGSTAQFTATGTYSDGTSADVTSTAKWTSSNATFAAISANGLVTGLAQGTSIIAVSMGLATSSTTMTVTPKPVKTLQLITVSPLNQTLTVGSTQQYAAMGTYSDSSTADISSSVNWSSTSELAATISAGGLATGAAVGTTTITAASGLVSGIAALNVTAAPLQSIAVTPASPSIAAGATRQFTATGAFSNGTHSDITANVYWSSSVPSVATMVSNGLAAGMSAGTTTISAASGNVSGTTTLTVTDNGSPDTSGLTWTKQLSGVNLNTVVWSGTQFVAAGLNVYTSPTGSVWTSHALPANSSLAGLVWTGAQYVGVGVDISSNTSAGVVLTSPNGIDWTPQTFSGNAFLNSVAWSGSLLVAVGGSDTSSAGAVFTSPDGAAWTSRSLPGTSYSLWSVTWSGSQFIAVGGGGKIFTSPNGIDWTSQSSGTNLDLKAAACSANSHCVVVGASGGLGGLPTILATTNGSDWNSQTAIVSPTFPTLVNIVWSGSEYLAVGGAANTGIVLTSPDGATWTQSAVTSVTTGYLNGVAWSSTLSRIVSAGMDLVTSP